MSRSTRTGPFDGDGDHPRPVVVLSRCIEQEACRYNGQMIRNAFVRQIEPFVRFETTCPEVGIGLGVPRAPIRLERTAAGTRLIQPSTGRDLTQAMREFARSFLDGLDDVDGFILKDRSPSCGLRDVKVHAANDGGRAGGKSAGLFAEHVLERFGHLAVEEEGRLVEPRIRHHFLTRLFAFAGFRTIEARPAIPDIAAYHSRHRLLFTAHNRSGVERLDEIVSGVGVGADRVAARYRAELDRVLARPARPGAWITAAKRAFGHVSAALSTRETGFFNTLVDEHRTGRQPVQFVLGVLAGWLARIEVPGIEAHAFFEPYPSALFRLEPH